MFFLLSFGIVISIFSQIESVAFVVRPLMYLFWVLFVFYTLIKVNKKGTLSRFSIYFLVVYAMFAVYCLGLSAMGYDHAQSHYLYVIPIALLMSILGNLCAPFLSSLRFYRLCYVYIGATLLFGIWVIPSYTNYQSVDCYSVDSCWGIAL